MSYSQNSETMPLNTSEILHVSKSFTKYGMRFTYGLVCETQPEWAPVPKTVDGVTTVEWELTGKNITTEYVQTARIFDEARYGVLGKFIEVFLTADGPILAITSHRDSEVVHLLDPCIVMFSGKDNSKLSYIPIFNVGRTLMLYHSAIRSVQAPSELLLAAYPGFLINNRMAQYQLRTPKPLITTALTDNLTT